MNLVNLAHGSLYMVGAYLAAAATQWTGNYLLAAWRWASPGRWSSAWWWK